MATSRSWDRAFCTKALNAGKSTKVSASMRTSGGGSLLEEAAPDVELGQRAVEVEDGRPRGIAAIGVPR